MRKERLLRQSQRITWCLQVLAGLCLVLLLAGQYVVLSSGGQKWTLVGQLEGEPLMELDPQTLLAGSAQERVYDVQLRAAGAQTDMVRLYINDHLTATLQAGTSVHLALEKGQHLSADGALLQEALVVWVSVEGSEEVESVSIEPGVWQDLVWEK